MGQPEQAAILCGGLGTRLRPLTDTVPKPMAPVNGRPFLAYLVEQLREQGVRRIVLMTGYLGEVIRDYFGDGARAGVEISYSEGPAEWETGRRIWEARGALDQRFFLLYSDNYVPVNLPALAARHAASGCAVTLLLAAKDHGNVLVTREGMVEIYDSTRMAGGLHHVEIGYMVVERDEILQAFTAPDVSFSTILASLSTRRTLAGITTGDAYHSISDSARWQLAARYLAGKRVLLIDRDGTINRRAPRGEYVTRWEDFHWIEDTVEAMRRLATEGFRFIVVSNQAGVARGMLDLDTVHRIHTKMCDALRMQGVEILATYLCPHHWDDGCPCRKPAPGMFFQASRDHLIRMDRTIYIGDDPRDARAAANAGCRSVLVGRDRDVDPGGGVRPDVTSASLTDAVPWILDRFKTWEAGPHDGVRQI